MEWAQEEVVQDAGYPEGDGDAGRGSRSGSVWGVWMRSTLHDRARASSVKTECGCVSLVSGSLRYGSEQDNSYHRERRP